MLCGLERATKRQAIETETSRPMRGHGFVKFDMWRRELGWQPPRRMVTVGKPGQSQSLSALYIH